MHSTARSARNACRAAHPSSLPPTCRPGQTSAPAASLPALTVVASASPAPQSVGQPRRGLATAASLSFPSSFQPGPALRFEHGQLRSAAWALFAARYSTKYPADLPLGSNNELDPRGVDYTLFEENPIPASATTSRSTAAAVPAHGLQDREGSTATSNAASGSSDKSNSERISYSGSPRSSRQLPPVAALLRRLIRNKEFHSAFQVLEELEILHTPLGPALLEYADAAIWSIRTGRIEEALHWLSICPVLHVPNRPDGTLRPFLRKSNEQLLRRVQKLFTLLLDTSGNDLRLLQRASFIVAEKGYWEILSFTLGQVLRYGQGVASTSAQGAESQQGWTFFLGLLHQARQASVQEQQESAKALRRRNGLRKLYRLGVRTLALSGRLDDAYHWVRAPLPGSEAAVGFGKDLLQLDTFTYHLLVDRLLRAGDPRYRALAAAVEDVIRARAAPDQHDLKLPSLAAIQRSIDSEAQLRDEARTEAQKETYNAHSSFVDRNLSRLIARGDLQGARNYLVSVLKAAELDWRSDDASTLVDVTMPQYGHLPSAAVVSDLQEAVEKQGPVTVLPPLVEEPFSIPTSVEDLQTGPQKLHPTQRTKDKRWRNSIKRTRETMIKTVTPYEFLSPVRRALRTAPAGKGLWETAQLLTLVRRRDWRGALQFYRYESGFAFPSGGITDELIALACGGTDGLPSAIPSEFPLASRKPIWPTIAAINLVLRALVNVCMEAEDYGRLENVYNTWKANSLARPAILSDAADGSEASAVPAPDPSSIVVAGKLKFAHWPPACLPSSATFAPFLRAFARREFVHETENEGADRAVAKIQTAEVRRKEWGGGQLALSVIRDMTADFNVRPGVASWTIVLETLAREGMTRWESTTERIANAMGIRTRLLSTETEDDAEGATQAIEPQAKPRRDQGEVPLRPHRSPQKRLEPLPALPPATLVTYTALLHGLLRAPCIGAERDSMVLQALQVRADLLRRLDLPSSTEELMSAAEEAGVVTVEEVEEGDEARFWQDLCRNAQEQRQLEAKGDEEPNGEDGGGKRTRWSMQELLANKQSARVLRQLFYHDLERRIEAEAKPSWAQPQGRRPRQDASI